MATSNTLAPLDERQRYSISETVRYLRISRASVYNLIRQGDLRTIREGARQFVPGAEIIKRSTLPATASAA
jgi:hypothetical protein